ISTGGSFCLLRLLEVPHLGRQIVTTQRDAEQEPHPGHDAIAITDARTALDQIELKTAHLVGRCRIGRSFEQGGEPLVALDVAALRARIELARGHVFDHTLTQRTDTVSLAHGSSFLSEVRNTSILRTGLPPRHRYPIGWLQAPRLTPPRSGLERSDFVQWP